MSRRAGVRGLTVLAAGGTGGAGGRPRLDGVSFDVRAGEILGIAAIDGNGQSELIDAIAGLADPAAGGSSGTMILAGLAGPEAAASGRSAASSAARARRAPSACPWRRGSMGADFPDLNW